MKKNAYLAVAVAKNDGFPTVQEVDGTLSRAFQTSMERLHSLQVASRKVEMLVFIKDRLDDLSSDYEGYSAVLFMNRPAVEVCTNAGMELNLLSEVDEDDLPHPVGVFLKLPLYSLADET